MFLIQHQPCFCSICYERVSEQSLAAFDSRNPKFRVFHKEEGRIRGLGEVCTAAGWAEGALKSLVGLSLASSCHRPHLFLELRPLTALCSGSYWLPTLLLPGQNGCFLNCATITILPAQPQPSPSLFLLFRCVPVPARGCFSVRRH